MNQESLQAEMLRRLFARWSGEEGIELEPLPESGSYRRYYRLSGHMAKAIGVYSPDDCENFAFLSFSRHFRSLGLNVPEIYAQDLPNHIYLLSDLGDVSLLNRLEAGRSGREPDEETRQLYRKTVAELPRFQVLASANLDFSLCYPTVSFDSRSMIWDLNYFKYYFLRLLKIPFNEYALEDDFSSLTEYLLQAGSDYFMYRDFQARNILIHNNEPWFIDYQGGRRGPLQYDLASLLFQVKAELPYSFREEMLYWYIECINRYLKIDEKEFIRYYYGFVLIRLLQVMGAYGFRGYYEHRAHFLQSIPYAVENLKWLLANYKLELDLPELIPALERLAMADTRIPNFSPASGLTVMVNSFSYKGAVPPDFSGNGGGFVFDCRILPNPGKFDHFKHFTGKDTPIIQFLEKDQEVGKFIENVKKIIDQAIVKYQNRGFTSLQINFGCTGGQHRSVYCAEKLARYIDDKYTANVVVNHTAIQKPWINMPGDSSIDRPEIA